MLTDLVQIRRLAEEKAEENLEFRRYLKAHHRPDEWFYDAAQRVERQMDCTACANCCRELRAAVTEADLTLLAAHLGLSVEATLAAYTERDPRDHERVLKQVDDACVFLERNRCGVYAARPRVCHEFPHFDSHARSLGNRMASIFSKAGLCPIIFNAVEEYKHRVGYRKAVH